MALSVTGTQYIKNTAPPVTDYPITVGCWIRPTAAGNVFRSVWQLSRSADPQDRLAIYQWTGSVWNALASVAFVDTSCTGGTVTAAAWVFVLARFISTTNRRLSVLNANGSTAHQQSTGSAVPTSLAEITIGADPVGGDTFQGMVGEVWYTNADIQVDNAQTQEALLRQLAYGGPFSVPHVAKDVLEYRSFRKHPFLVELGEVYFGGRGIQTWAPTATPATGLHPPLPYWYEKPGQSKTVLTI